MLTISKPLSAGQAATYHAAEFSNAKANYYAEGSEIVGRWQGRLAGHFSLGSDVRDDQFERLANGQHPSTGVQLIRRASAQSYVNVLGETVAPMEHRAAWDATFSAPKSVSLVALVGGDTRVRQAHRESVAVALSELEQFTQARLGGARLPETTGQFVAATFEHDSARPVDGYSAPQLHTHAVVFNLTQTSRGRIRSVQPRELYRSQAFGTAVYRAELAQRLHRLGYSVERGASGQPEIRGLTKEYLDAASPRRQQIREQLEASGRLGAGAAQIAAHQTRERKIAHGKDEVQRQHQEMATLFGNQPQHAVANALRTAHRHEPDAETGARDAVGFAKARNIERNAVADERALLADALRRAMGTAVTSDVRTEFQRRAAGGEFLSRAPAPTSAARAWTTPEMVALEQATIARMREGLGTFPALVPDAVRRSVVAGATHLLPGQRDAVEQMLSSRDQIIGLDGIAGAGKTTTLAVVRAAAERGGYNVRGLAPTSRAALLLADAGMPTETLQRHIARGAEPVGRPSLTILDESSLASTVLMKQFLDRMQSGDRVLLVGDVRQHQSVEAGRVFEQLQESGLRPARLTDVVRQRDTELRAVVEHLAAGDVPSALKQLSAAGKVHAIPHRGARMEALTHAVLEAPGRTLVVCPDNQSRQDINAAIHKALQDARSVAENHTPTRVLVPRQDVTSADRAYADRYDVGDTVRYAKGSQAHRLAPGAYAVVTARETETNQLTVTTRDGQVITYDPRRLQGVSVYREEIRALAVGDRIQFTAPSLELRVANRQLGTVEILEQGTMRVALDSGRRLTFPLEAHPHVDFGYAVTSHSSQGQTADRVIVHIDSERAGESLVNQRLAYVALSRGREEMQVFTDNAARLTHNLGREVSNRSAIEQRNHQLSPA